MTTTKKRVNHEVRLLLGGFLMTFLLCVTVNIGTATNETGRIGERFVGAYYYVWYQEGWTLNDNTPLLGYHVSDNETVIRKHLEWAKMAEIDFLAISWSNSLEWHDGITALVTEKVFSVDDHIGSPVKLAIMIEYWHGEFLDLTEAADYVYSKYVSSPSYFKLYGKPLLFVYTLDDYSPPKWNDNRFTVRYIPLQVPYGRDTFIERSLKNQTTYEFTGVGPHKDNLHIDRDRANGSYYSTIWEQVIQFSELAADRPLIVMIASFNEWWESTNIEPCSKYGFQYLKITRKYVAKLKSTEQPRAQKDFVRLPDGNTNIYLTISYPMGSARARAYTIM